MLAVVPEHAERQAQQELLVHEVQQDAVDCPDQEGCRGLRAVLDLRVRQGRSDNKAERAKMGL